MATNKRDEVLPDQWKMQVEPVYQKKINSLTVKLSQPNFIVFIFKDKKGYTWANKDYIHIFNEKDVTEITPEQFLKIKENPSLSVEAKGKPAVTARETAQTKMLQADDQGARDAQGYTGRKETIVGKTHYLEYWHKGRLVMRGSFEEKPQEVDYSDLYRANAVVES